MLVRIRFGKGPTLSVRRRKKQRFAHAAAALLTPAALMALALALWGMAANLRWTTNFAITTGVFSYWQTWLALAAALQFGSWALTRYGKSRDESPV